MSFALGIVLGRALLLIDRVIDGGALVVVDSGALVFICGVILSLILGFAFLGK